ncbi:MAG TPA: asparagine synthase-related protein, partial [Terriglobales bacterium]|nr:asparagine synthase-related protein [Terriglobales bacterium]
LYYSVQQGQVFWSSRLQAVVDATGISELDEQYIGAFLLYGGCPNRTPYKGIYPVPAGHAVCVSSTDRKIRSFWALPIRDEIRYRNEHRYQEQLRSLFREAVSVRLQADGPVLAELSGGLDSSSVVSMANHLIRGGAVGATDLKTVSYVWRDSLDDAFIREMESFCGIEGVHISTHEVPLISEEQVGQAIPEILQPLRKSVASVARQLGARTILTGINGDLMMGNWFDDSLQLAAYLRRLCFSQLWKEALAWSKLLRRPVYQLLWQGACAALPPALTPASVYTDSDGSYTVKSSETSLTRPFIDQLGLSQSGILSDAWVQAAPQRRRYFRALSIMLELRLLQTPELWQHLDYTHPFAHRPLVEFLMTVPVDVLCRPGEPRRMMRPALSNLWPPKLRARRSKGSFNLPWQEALRPLARVLMNARKLHLVERGYVNGASVLSRLQRLSAGLDCNLDQLRHIVVLELWLRNQRLMTEIKKGGESNEKRIPSSRTELHRARR